MKPMLAKKYTNQNIDGWLMSEKLDGVRAFWDGEKFVSRNNKPLNAPQWFKDIIPNNFHADGELTIGRGMFQKTVSVVRKKVPIDYEWKDVKYKIFDAPYFPGSFGQRINLLNEFIKLETIAEVLPHTYCISEEHMREAFTEVVSNGGEGLILRNPYSDYEEKRSSNMLKVKPMEINDAIVTGFLEGEGKYVGMLGALSVEWNGKKFNIGSGLTDEHRANPGRYFKLGSTIIFKCQCFTDAGIPRFPVFLAVRNYE